MTGFIGYSWCQVGDLTPRIAIIRAVNEACDSAPIGTAERVIRRLIRSILQEQSRLSGQAMNDDLKALLSYYVSHDRQIVVFEIPRSAFTSDQLWRAFSPIDEYPRIESINKVENRYTLRFKFFEQVFQFDCWKTLRDNREDV